MKLPLRFIFLSTMASTGVFAQRPLFTRFPALQQTVAHIELCDLPTPIVRLENFGNSMGLSNLFMKRDDLSGKNMENGFHLYGGNKPRKLEFLLADAKHKNAKTIITYGCAGSNHALATAIYAHILGLKSLLMLKNQPNSYVVRHNLLLDNQYGAQLQFFENNTQRANATEKLLQEDNTAYLIPTGGSTPLGAIGFVNAAFELAEQIDRNEMPKPDLIYLATGSCGTVAGLLLGIAASQLTTKVVAVCVEPEETNDNFLLTIQELFAKTNALLHAHDSSFPLYAFPHENLVIEKKFWGTEYGLFTPEAANAIKIFKDTENVALDATYSSRPIAALIEDAASGALTNKVVLFWNTYCGIDYSYMTTRAAYKQLPPEFHTYFEQEVQPLAKL